MSVREVFLRLALIVTVASFPTVAHGMQTRRNATRTVAIYAQAKEAAHPPSDREPEEDPQMTVGKLRSLLQKQGTQNDVRRVFTNWLNTDRGIRQPGTTAGKAYQWLKHIFEDKTASQTLLSNSVESAIVASEKQYNGAVFFLAQTSITHFLEWAGGLLEIDLLEQCNRKPIGSKSTLSSRTEQNTAPTIIDRHRVIYKQFCHETDYNGTWQPGYGGPGPPEWRKYLSEKLTTNHSENAFSPKPMTTNIAPSTSQAPRKQQYTRTSIQKKKSSGYWWPGKRGRAPKTLRGQCGNRRGRPPLL